VEFSIFALSKQTDMTTIEFNDKKHTWGLEKKVFTVSERDVPFDTTYEIRNPKSGGKMKFEFSHSTGPEFNPQTKWIYYNSDKTVTLEVCNDPEIVRRAAENYLKSKLGKN